MKKENGKDKKLPTSGGSERADKPGKKRKKGEVLLDLLFVLAGAAIFGAGINVFLLPKDINVGGASGLATVIHHLLGGQSAIPVIPVGVLILIINVPLLILAIKQNGWRSMLRTIVGTVAVSLASDLFALLLTFVNLPSDLVAEPSLSALCGGGMMGFGSGLMMIRGYTSGGSDLAAYLLHRRVPRISTGRTILAIDILVIGASAIVMRDYHIVIYCVISSAVYGFAIDYMMRGANDCRCAMIISDKHEEIAKAIAERLNRGVTELEGRGWYTKEGRTVLMCVVRRREEFSLRKLITTVDPRAFVIMTTSCEAMGDGFSES